MQKKQRFSAKKGKIIWVIDLFIVLLHSILVVIQKSIPFITYFMSPPQHIGLEYGVWSVYIA